LVADEEVSSSSELSTIKEGGKNKRVSERILQEVRSQNYKSIFSWSFGEDVLVEGNSLSDNQLYVPTNRCDKKLSVNKIDKIVNICGISC
jgi:hypothetical protein